MRKMATAKVALLNSSEYINMNFEDFKAFYITRIGWSETEWKANKESDSNLCKFIKSARFWFGNMKETTNESALVVTLFKNSGDTLPKVLDIIRNIKLVLTLKDFTGYSIGRNKYFYVLNFVSKQAREKAAAILTLVNKAYVIQADWYVKASMSEFSITWLPITINLKNVENFLNPVIKLEELKRVMDTLDDEDTFPTGQIIGKGIIRKTIKANEIPYIIMVEGYKGLLTINGRDPICFNCDLIGHVSKDCPTPYCKQCRSKHRKSTTCDEKGTGMSYALAVKNKNDAELQRIWDNTLSQYYGNQEGGTSQRISILDDSHSLINSMQSNAIDVENKLINVQQENSLGIASDISIGFESRSGEKEVANSNSEVKNDSQTINLDMEIDQSYNKRKVEDHEDIETSNSFDNLEKKSKQNYSRSGMVTRGLSTAEKLFDRIT